MDPASKKLMLGFLLVNLILAISAASAGFAIFHEGLETNLTEAERTLGVMAVIAAAVCGGCSLTGLIILGIYSWLLPPRETEPWNGNHHRRPLL